MNKPYESFKRKIFILRHAKAETGHGLKDFDRPLADKGIQQAQELGSFLDERDWLPELIMTSPALRTKQTSKNLISSLSKRIPLEEKHIIYEGYRDDLFEVFQKTQDTHTRVMMVGHNPDIHGLAALLTTPEQSNDYLYLQTVYKTCTLAILGTNIDKWSQLRPHSCTLLSYIRL